MKSPFDSSVIEPIPLHAKNCEGLSGVLEIVEHLLQEDNLTSFPSSNPSEPHTFIATEDDAIELGWYEGRGVVRNHESMHPTTTFDDTYGSPCKKMKTCSALDSNCKTMSQDLPELEREALSYIPQMMENFLGADNSSSFVCSTPLVSSVESLQYKDEEVDITGKIWHDNVGIVRSHQSISRSRMVDEMPVSPDKEFNACFSEACTKEQPKLNCFSNCTSLNDSTKNNSLYSGTLHSVKWNQNFQDLVDFREVHSHCLVPHKWRKNIGLAHWVKRQRCQYKLKKDGLRTTLTDSREQALNKLGFVWEPQAARWEETLNEIREYKRIHGTCNVPGKCTAFPRLALWVNSQRRQYRNFMRGKQSTLTRERIEKLNALGIKWNPRSLKLKEEGGASLDLHKIETILK